MTFAIGRLGVLDLYIYTNVWGLSTSCGSSHDGNGRQLQRKKTIRGCRGSCYWRDSIAIIVMPCRGNIGQLHPSCDKILSTSSAHDAVLIVCVYFFIILFKVIFSPLHLDSMISFFHQLYYSSSAMPFSVYRPQY